MIVILLGSNIGDRKLALEEAKSMIDRRIGKLLVISSIFESEPWGFKHKNYFLNQVILVDTSLPPNDLLNELLIIEKMLGRKREKSGYSARIIDLDILFYNDLIISEDSLKIPHPRLHERRFTLLPLSEILPEYIHPVLEKPINTLLNECEDSLIVRKL